jgi:hypothetical protein
MSSEEVVTDTVQHRSHEFAELAALNAGVVLDPLRISIPVKELDTAVIKGIAGLSANFVKDVIDGHTDGLDERTLFLKRFKEIRILGTPTPQTPLIGESALPADVTTNKKREKSVSKPFDQVVEELLFHHGGEEPDLSKIPEIVNKRPTSPDAIFAIVKPVKLTIMIQVLSPRVKLTWIL